MNRSLSPEVQDIYKAYFEYLRSQNKGRPSTHFSASSAGHCFKKHQFKLLDADRTDLEEKSLGRLRLGDLIHTDIQDGCVSQGLPVMNEVRLIDDSLRVMGHTDIMYFPDKFKFIVLKDLKTVGDFAWKKKFGRDASDKDDKYEMQVGTYAYLAENKFGIEVKQLAIVYVKVSDISIWKEVPVDIKYKSLAVEYWKQVNNAVKNELKPGVDYGVPMSSWECNYCPFKGVCDSPYIKR